LLALAAFLAVSLGRPMRLFPKVMMTHDDDGCFALLAWTWDAFEKYHSSFWRRF
jgi:hypothetical protein